MGVTTQATQGISTDEIQNIMFRDNPDWLPDLVCPMCDEVLHSLEDGDYLEVLIAKAFGHVCPGSTAVKHG